MYAARRWYNICSETAHKLGLQDNFKIIRIWFTWLEKGSRKILPYGEVTILLRFTRSLEEITVNISQHIVPFHNCQLYDIIRPWFALLHTFIHQCDTIRCLWEWGSSNQLKYLNISVFVMDAISSRTVAPKILTQYIRRGIFHRWRDLRKNDGLSSINFTPNSRSGKI